MGSVFLSIIGYSLMKMRREKVLTNYKSKLNSKKWKQLLDASQTPFIICDSQKILFTNAHMKNLLGIVDENGNDTIHNVTINITIL